MSLVRRAVDKLKDMARRPADPLIDLPDGSTLGLTTREQVKKKDNQRRLNVNLSFTHELGQGVDMYVYVNGNIVQITDPSEGQGFRAGVSFTRRF